MQRIIFFIACIVCIACASANTENIAIRYVQLSVLYNYVVQTSPDALAAQKQYAALQAQLDSSQLQNEDEKKKLELKMKTIVEQMEKQKKEFLMDIKHAIENVAKRKGYTVVLGGGDTVVYAQEGLDITNEVLRELVAIRLQKSPVVR